MSDDCKMIARTFIPSRLDGGNAFPVDLTNTPAEYRIPHSG